MVGRRAPRKKIPGRPRVSKPRLGLRTSREWRIRIVPVRSLLTKKTAPPPSLARLSTHGRPDERQREPVAVQVDRAATATASGAGTGGVGTASDCAVADEGAVLDAPGHADAADRAAVAAPSAREGAADDVHGSVAVLVEHADRRPAQIGPAPVAAVADERRVDDLQLPAAGEDRATTAAVVPLAGGVATSERQVADDESRVGLVVAVGRGPDLLRVARVLVEDPALAHPAQGHQSATVDHHATGGVDHLRGPPHLDGHRSRAAVEPDHATAADGSHHRGGRAARPRPVTHHPHLGFGDPTLRLVVRRSRRRPRRRRADRGQSGEDCYREAKHPAMVGQPSPQVPATCHGSSQPHSFASDSAVARGSGHWGCSPHRRSIQDNRATFAEWPHREHLSMP